RARDESRSNRERKRDARRGVASCSKHSHPFEKARLGDSVASKWLQGTVTRPYNPSQLPSISPFVKLVSPSLMPKLGKAGSLQSRQAIVHSLVHTESWAIDLSWLMKDIIARFGKKEAMPREFFTDFVKVAQDEGRHFSLLAARLKDFGSSYGALPAHDGLWDSAIATSKDLLARLAIEHCIHEKSTLYQDILALEESEAGRSETQMDKESEEVIQKFHAIVRTHFRGPLKPPFNEIKESCWLRPSVV
ncbi:hypothetical protein Gogos_003775, partial [Gossypium gossypioides]|nr:hypothetical protein [Gossypium gossypioides]